MKEFRCDKLQVEIFPDRKELGQKAGSDAARCLMQLLEEQETVNIMFAAAPSQNETLAALMSCKAIDWKRVNAFHMDEYAGIDAENPASFRNFLSLSETNAYISVAVTYYYGYGETHVSSALNGLGNTSDADDVFLQVQLGCIYDITHSLFPPVRISIRLHGRLQQVP